VALMFLVAASAAWGCGGGAPAKDAAPKSDAAKADAPKAEAPKTDAPKADPPKADPTAAPWSDVQVRDAMVAGTKLVYARTGTNAKGKKIDDSVTFVLRANTSEGAGTSFTIDPDPGTNAASSQVATMAWTKQSPFFAMEKAEVKISGRESVVVPAGTYDASVAELTDFFGNTKTVYMIVDKPGVYAKVLEKANAAADPKDKTDLVYELKAIEAP
jgi:hypothetical protein